jgi:ATP-binding cassette subfamily B (MDR/TAP) protein 1
MFRKFVLFNVVLWLQVGMFQIAGERLVLKLRLLSIKAIMKQEMGWFDRAENSTGALMSRLSEDASSIKGVSSKTCWVV